MMRSHVPCDVAVTANACGATRRMQRSITVQLNKLEEPLLRHLALDTIQSTPSHTRYFLLRSILILSFHLRLPPRNRVLEKLTVAQLVKKCLAFYGARRFIAVFNAVPHRSLAAKYNGGFLG
jgi:hypothetical protein